MKKHKNKIKNNKTIIIAKKMKMKTSMRGILECPGDSYVSIV